MSKLDELIKELCPNGVEYKRLGELGIFENIGVDKKVNINEKEILLLNYTDIYKNNYIDRLIPKMVVTANDKKIENCSVEEWDIFITPTSETKEDIGHASVILETISNCCYSYHIMRYRLINPNRVTASFIMYLFYSQDLKKQILKYAQGLTRYGLSKEKFSNLLIPFPNIRIQEEIVKILDDYTKSVEELKEKLNEELIARKKQYSWYRDYLLKFENKIEIVKLGDIVEVYDGTHQTPDYKKTGIPFISVENIDNIYNTEKYISEEDYEKNYRIKPKIDDIFMTRIGTIGKCAIVTKNNPLAYYVSLALLRPNKNKIDSAYLKYIIESGIGKKELNKRILFTAVPIKINKGDIDKLEIPLPSLEVQKRIVEVLDNFEKICNDLNIGLPAEIEAREKQYEYYRNILLTFNDEEIYALSKQASQPAQNLIKILQYVYGYVEVRLGDIGSIVRGNGLQKRDFTEEGVGCIHYGQIYTKYGMVAEKTISFVEESLAEKLRKVEKGDIIFAVTSENIEDLCKCVVWLGEEEIVTGGHTAILKHNQNSKFLAYYFQTEAFHSQKRKLATGTKVMDVTATKLEEILIPLPPLEEQQKIVDILDRFDKLCNDISKGLPAEIEVRQKQYEYFREKLLSFKKL